MKIRARLINFIGAAFLIGLLFVTCYEPAPSHSEVAGTYNARLKGASEVLVLRADGTFSQVLRMMPASEAISATGTWNVKYKAVNLDGYMVCYEGMTNGVFLSEPRKNVGLTFEWRANMLIRDWGDGLYILDKEIKE